MFTPKTIPRPIPKAMCAECELPYRHHDDFERCLFVAHEQYFRAMTSLEYYAYRRRQNLVLYLEFT